MDSHLRKANSILHLDVFNSDPIHEETIKYVNIIYNILATKERKDFIKTDDKAKFINECIDCHENSTDLTISEEDIKKIEVETEKYFQTYKKDPTLIIRTQYKVMKKDEFYNEILDEIGKRIIKDKDLDEYMNTHTIKDKAFMEIWIEFMDEYDYNENSSIMDDVKIVELAILKKIKNRLYFLIYIIIHDIFY